MLERDPALGDDDLLDRLRATSQRVRELVPDCIGMSVAVLEDDLVVTLVATEAEIAVLDAVQYLFTGPCVEAVRAERVLEVNEDSLLDEDEWRLFALASAAPSVASTLTLPILVDGRISGSVNLYAASTHAFTGFHEPLAELFGAWAPGAVANADLSFSTRQRAEDAPRHQRERTRFDTAVGLLAAREGLTLEDARERLRDAAARGRVSEARLAQAVITYYTRDTGSP